MWVRTASKRDLATVSELLGKVWHATYGDIYGAGRVSEITAEWHSLAALEKQLKAPNSEFLLADDGTAIAGMAYAAQISATEVKLHQLYVLPGHQGRGVGKMLLEELGESFFDVPTMVLEVEEKNTGATGFYQKHGFHQTGTVSNCGKKDSGIPALVFSKSRD
jgi:ribosomal protein S18 acetylase RimI-like enzyme